MFVYIAMNRVLLKERCMTAFTIWQNVHDFMPLSNRSFVLQ